MSQLPNESSVASARPAPARAWGQLPSDVARVLRNYRNRRTLLRVARWVLAIAAGYGVLVLLAVHVDRFVVPEPGSAGDLRWPLFVVVHLLLALGIAAAIALTLARRQTVTQLAYEVEQRAGLHDERMVTVSAVPRASDGPPEGDALHGELVRQLESQATSEASGLRGAALARDRWLAPSAIAFAVVLLLGLAPLAIAGYQWPLMVARFYQPTADLDRPSYVTVTITPGDQIVGRGGEVALQATVVDDRPAWLAPLLRALAGTTSEARLITYPVDESGQTTGPPTTTEMTRVQRDRFLLNRSDLQESFAYEAAVASTTSDRAVISVLDRPRVTQVVVRVEYPDYTGVEPFVYENPDQPLPVLPGSEVSLRFQADQELTRYTLTGGDDEELVGVRWDPESLAVDYDLTFQESQSIELEVENLAGFTNVEPVQVTLQRREDQAPIVQLDLPPVRSTAIPTALLGVAAALSDDFGLAEAEIQYFLNPDENPDQPPLTESVTLPEGSAITQEITQTLDLAEIGAAPGDTLLLRLRVRDTADNDALSRPAIVRVVPLVRGLEWRGRVIGLALLSDTLASAAAQGDDQAAVEAVDAETFEEVRDIAEPLRLPWPDEPSLALLAPMLLVEHDLWAGVDGQGDIRLLHGVLSRRLAASDAPTAATWREIQEQAVGPIADGRLTRNVLRRAMGLAMEARRLQADLEALADAGEGIDDRFERRARALLDAVQDLGADSLRLARNEASPLEVDDIRPLVGDLNTAAILATRGGPSRRAGQIGSIIRATDAIVELIRSAIPSMLRRELAARHWMLSDQAEALAALGAGPPPAWLVRGSAMLEREPGAVWLQRLRFFAAQRGPAEVNWPDRAERAAVEARRTARGLAIESQLNALQRDPRVTPIELVQERAMLAVESALRRGEAPTDAVIDAWNALGWQQPGADELPGPMQTAVDEADNIPAGAGRVDPMVVQAIVAEVAAPELTDPGVAIAERLRSAREALDVVRSWVGAVNANQPERLAATTPALRDRLREEARQLSLLVTGLSLRATATPSEPNPGLDDAWMNARRAIESYQQRIATSIDRLSIVEERGLTSETAIELTVQATRLGAIQEGLITRLEELDASFRETEEPGEEEEAARPSLLAIRLAESAELAALTNTLAETPDALGAAAQIVERFPMAGGVWIRRQRPLAAELVDDIRLVQLGLSDEVPDHPDRGPWLDAEVLGRIAANLDRLGARFDPVRATPAGERIAPQLATVARTVATLRELPTGAIRGSDLARAEFVASEAVRESDRLLAALERADQRAEASVSVRLATVSPDNPLSLAYRQSERRIGEMIERSRDEALASAIAATIVGSDDDGRPGDRAFAWADRHHKMLRNPVIVVSAQPPPPAPQEEDEWLKFLSSELADAKTKLGQSERSLRAEYLDLVEPYLRY